nr:oligosaccharide flippase family protein [Chitinophagaceae bacterium]
MLLLNLLVKPLWIFVIDRNVQLTTGHEEYGLYGALVSISLIFNILLDLGITNYNNKTLAAENSLIHSKLPNMIVAKSILSLVYFTVVILVALLFQYGVRALFLVFLLATVQMLNSFLMFLRSNVSAHHHFKTDALLSVLDKVLMIGICSVLLFSPQLRTRFVIEWFLFAQIAAYLISILTALTIVIRRYSKIHFHHFSISEVVSICKKSLPYAVLILLMAIYMRSDVLMLERLAGTAQNYIYLEAYRILEAANMIAFLFAGILLPMFSRMISQKVHVENLVVTTANMMLPASLALVAFCIVFAEPIMKILYPNDVNPQLILSFSFIIGSFPAFCIMYIYSTLLTANGNITLLIKIALFGGVLSIGSNLILIHVYQSVGAALTCFIVEWLLGAIYIYYCIKEFHLKIQFSRITQFVIVFALMCFLNVTLRYFEISLPYAIAGNGITFLLVVYSIKLWDKKLIEPYFKQFSANS